MWRWHTEDNSIVPVSIKEAPSSTTESLLLRSETSPLKVTAVVLTCRSYSDHFVRVEKKPAFQKVVWILKWVGSFNEYLDQLSYLGRIQGERIYIEIYS